MGSLSDSQGPSCSTASTRRAASYSSEIGVAADYRRRGAGRALILSLLGICREQDLLEMFVLADADDSRARAFYRSTGGESSDSALFTYKTINEST